MELLTFQLQQTLSQASMTNRLSPRNLPEYSSIVCQSLTDRGYSEPIVICVWCDHRLTGIKKYDIKSLSIPSTENCLLSYQGLSSWVKMNRKQLFYIVQITTMEAKSRKSQTGPAMYCDRKSSKLSQLQQQNRLNSFTALKLQKRPI